MTLSGSHVLHLRRPPGEVFALVSDLERAPRWVSGLVAVTKLTPGPTGVGTRFRQRAQLGGRELDGEIEISAFEPDRLFAHRGRLGPAELWGRFELEPEPGGTRLTHRYEIRLTGLARALGPLIASRAEHSTADALAALRRLLEGIERA